MKVSLFAVLFPLLAVTASAVAAQDTEPSNPFANGRDARDIPFELNSDKIYVKVGINDAGPFWMVLDTGSPGMIIDTRTAGELGLEVGEAFDTRGAGQGAFSLAPVRSPVHVSLPGLTVPDQGAYVGPIDRIVGPFEGRRIDGVLGCSNIFANQVVEIDYRGRRFSVVPTGDFEPAADAHSLGVEVRDGHAFFRATILPLRGDPVSGEFMLDTGLRGPGILHTPFVRAHDLIARSSPTVYTTVGGGVGGQVSSHVGRVRWFEFADLRIAGIHLGFSQDEVGLLSTDYASGVIGSAILQRFRVVFDYPRSRVVLYEDQFDAGYLDFDKSGTFLVSDEADRTIIRVIDIIPQSPATETGLCIGDRIVRVDDRDAAGLTLEGVRNLFRRETGTKCRLVYERAGERMSGVLVLRPVI